MSWEIHYITAENRTGSMVSCLDTRDKAIEEAKKLVRHGHEIEEIRENNITKITKEEILKLNLN